MNVPEFVLWKEKVKISILPTPFVPVGVKPLDQRMVAADPLIFNVVGMYPVDPCVTITFVVIM